MAGASSNNNVIEPKVSTPSRRKLLRIAITVLVVTLLLAIGIIPRVLRGHEAREIVHASTVLVPEVIVIHPQFAPAQTSLSLPGNLEPLYSASVFARTNGYVERRLVDIGAHVKAGQTLAVISTPEVDQQLNQARAEVLQAAASVQQTKASLQQAEANLDLARITRDRYTHLSGTRAVTPQSVDEVDQAFNARTADVAAISSGVSLSAGRRVSQAASHNGSRSLFSIAQSNVIRVQVEVPQSSALSIKDGQTAVAANANIAVAQANLQSQKANVQRLVQLQGFERVVAPFEGVITARNVEQGDLVNGRVRATITGFGHR
jgi:multidrug efflux pump subunit AcrA (membrane-fusion protein)